MSDNIVPLQTVLINDPRLELNNVRKYAVLRGGQNVSWQQFQANSISNSNIQVTCNPPSRRHVIARRVYLNATFSLTFSGSGGTDNILQPEFDGPRAYPLSSIITSQTMSFANTTVSLGNFNEYWPYLLRYHNNVESQDWNYGMTPSEMDQFQNLGDWQNKGATTATGWGVGGTARNPLCFYGENSAQTSRGGFGGLTVLTNTTNSATATLTVTEPIFMSPLIFARGDSQSGFTGIEQMTYTAQLGTLSNIWSHGIANTSPQPFNTPVVTLTRAQLLFEYLEPSAVSPIPRAISYPLFTVQPSITNTNVAFSVLGGGSDTQSLTNLSLQLNGVPRRMYIFARNPVATTSYLTSDVALRLKQLTVQFDSNTYLASASEFDLYQMSRKNGINLSWSQWTSYTGSVMCCEFGTDIGMSPVFAPGVQGTHQLLITGLFQNINPSVSYSPTNSPPNPVTLYVIVIYEGTISSVDGTVVQQQNVLSNADALNAAEGMGASYRQSESVFGGNFFSDIGNFFKGAYNAVAPIAKPLASAAKTITGLIPHPYAQGANKVLTAIGAGAMGGHEMMGGIRSHMRRAMHGGRRLVRSSRLMGRGLEGDDQDDYDEQADGGSNYQSAVHEAHGSGREKEEDEHRVSFADEHGGEIAEYSDGEELDGGRGDAVEDYIARSRRR